MTVKRGVEDLEVLCVRAFLRVLESICLSPRYWKVRQELRDECMRSVPWLIRQHLIEEVLRGGRLYNTLELFLLETLLAPDVKRLAVRQVRKWYRPQFLELLAGRGTGLQVLLVEDITWLTGPETSIPFCRTLGFLTNLRHVSLRFVCDDSILTSLGQSCPQLEEVDTGGSLGVSDAGVQRMCLKAVAAASGPNRVSSEKPQQPAREKAANEGCVDILCRVFRQMFVDCFLEDALDEQTSMPTWWRNSVIKRAKRNPCCQSLRIINITSTRVTNKGIDLIRSCAPKAEVLAS